MSLWIEDIGIVPLKGRMLSMYHYFSHFNDELNADRRYLPRSSEDLVGPVYIYPVIHNMQKFPLVAVQINTETRRTRLLLFVSESDAIIAGNINKYIPLIDKKNFKVVLRRNEEVKFGNVVCSSVVDYDTFVEEVKLYDHDSFFEKNPKMTKYKEVDVDRFTRKFVAVNLYK